MPPLSSIAHHLSLLRDRQLIQTSWMRSHFGRAKSLISKIRCCSRNQRVEELFNRLDVRWKITWIQTSRVKIVWVQATGCSTVTRSSRRHFSEDHLEYQAPKAMSRNNVVRRSDDCLRSRYSPIAQTDSIFRSPDAARSIRHRESKFAQVFCRCTMTSSERRVTSGKVWNKEDDRREKSEKADAGQEVDWFLALSPEDNLYSTSYSTIVSFVRSWAGSKARLFFLHLAPLVLSPLCHGSVARFAFYGKVGNGESWDQHGESAPRPLIPLSPLVPLAPPLWSYETASRDLPSDIAVINHPTASCSTVNVALRWWLLHPDPDDQARHRKKRNANTICLSDPGPAFAAIPSHLSR